MANLAIIGSHTINGVAELHTHLLQTGIFPEFYELWPDKFLNMTNGVTPRRYILYPENILKQIKIFSDKFTFKKFYPKNKIILNLSQNSPKKILGIFIYIFL